jgi:hypothetical protein
MTTKPKNELAPDSDLGGGKVLVRSRACCALEQVITALRSARRHERCADDFNNVANPFPRIGERKNPVTTHV